MGDIFAFYAIGIVLYTAMFGMSYYALQESRYPVAMALVAGVCAVALYIALVWAVLP